MSAVQALAAQTPVFSSQRTESVMLRLVMRLHDPSLLCTQSAYHHGQWCNEVGTNGPIGPSFPPASKDGRSASQLLGFLNTMTDFSEG
ncbi:hypothetical protein TNCV_4598611 [Trichonephila clavipes]|nr:hypothetical protein TNCV_4598611 [Trichonephila clavipes]